MAKNIGFTHYGVPCVHRISAGLKKGRARVVRRGRGGATYLGCGVGSNPDMVVARRPDRNLVDRNNQQGFRNRITLGCGNKKSEGEWSNESNTKKIYVRRKC